MDIFFNSAQVALIDGSGHCPIWSRPGAGLKPSVGFSFMPGSLERRHGAQRGGFQAGKGAKGITVPPGRIFPVSTDRSPVGAETLDIGVPVLGGPPPMTPTEASEFIRALC